MKKKYNVLLLGLGNIAMGYDLARDDVCWTHLKAISMHINFTLISAIDPDVKKRAVFENSTGLSAYSTLQEFFCSKHPDIDLVVIATPTSQHLKNYREVKELNPSLVVMEKPLANSIEKLDILKSEMINGPNIIVNLFRLYQHGLNKKLAELNLSGYCNIQVRYSQTLLHNGIHFITLIESHFGRCLSSKKVLIDGEACFILAFKNASAVFQKSSPDLDDNSMTVQSSLGTFYYLNGGRITFFIDSVHIKTEFDQHEFNFHMLNVYDQCFKFFESKSDESLSLAISGQSTLLKCEEQDA